MFKINWDVFRIKNENQTSAFENLCYHLFCRKFRINDGIKADFNQAGLETEPIKYGSKYYGFQSKYFEKDVDYSQIEKSIKKAIDGRFSNLDTIYIYLNQKAKISCKSAKNIVAIASKKNVTIEWFTLSQFEKSLSIPSNLDLTQLYFNQGDEIGFVKNSINSEILTFLQSSDFITLPYNDSNNNAITNIVDEILNSTTTISLLTGNPGSGKSIFINYLLYRFGGLDKKSDAEMRKYLLKNKFVPVLINLKNCTNDTLENLIRIKKIDSQIAGKNLDFVYLLDGLDELNEFNAESVLSQTADLAVNGNTKKIIITCRSGNINKVKLKAALKNIIEYKISDLSVLHIENYFKAKGVSEKIDKLNLLKSINLGLIDEIKDILITKLFWDTIDTLDEKSSILDLFSKKINHLLGSHLHSKDLYGLNILNPKKEQILELNQDFAYKFQQNYQFRFPLKDLQQIILNKFPRLDYRSINDILNYISSIFFDNFLNSDSNYYVYHHRRYQEYFFLQKIKMEYEISPKSIRELNVFSNTDLRNLFLKYIRNEYVQNNNLIGLIELNLINTYLGKNENWGADEPYFSNSDKFISAIACQSSNVFEILLSEENLNIKEKIKLSPKNICILYENNKSDLATEYLKLLEDWIEKSQTEPSLVESITNLVSDEFEAYLYIQVIIKKVPLKNVFEKLIRANYSKQKTNQDQSYSAKKQLVKSFFRVSLKENSENTFGFLSNISEFEYLCFLEVLSSIEFLQIFIESKTIQSKILEYVKNYKNDLSDNNWIIIFYKKYFNLEFTQSEREFLSNYLKKYFEKRDIDLDIGNLHYSFALAAFSDDLYSFEKFFTQNQESSSMYFNGRSLYASLFKEYVSLLSGKSKLESIIRNYLQYFEVFLEETHSTSGLKNELTILWAYLFSAAGNSLTNKSAIKDRLITTENYIKPFLFYTKLYELNSSLYGFMVNDSDFQFYEEELKTWNDDYPSYIDRCFNLSILLSSSNESKAVQYITKAINDGILRHGWRKDPIVSYYLIDAFKIILTNNWASKDALTEYATKIFNLSIKVTEITDGKVTWRGPYNLIQAIVDYDLELAEKFKIILIEKEGYRNYLQFLITIILESKIKSGFPLELIEKGIKEYHLYYDNFGKPHADFFEERFKVYLLIASSAFYTDNQRLEAFNKACSIIDEIKNYKIDYYLNDNDFEDEKLLFRDLCLLYGKEFPLTLKDENPAILINTVSESNFVNEINFSVTIEHITTIYEKLINSDYQIILTEFNSWKVLLDKTFAICGNVDLFVNLLHKNHYPHLTHWSHSAEFFHIGVGYALHNINVKKQIQEYLFENSGHAGFLNIMKAYEVMNNREMCLKIFNRFLSFCTFLVE